MKIKGNSNQCLLSLVTIWLIIIMIKRIPDFENQAFFMKAMTQIKTIYVMWIWMELTEVVTSAQLSLFLHRSFPLFLKINCSRYKKSATNCQQPIYIYLC